MIAHQDGIEAVLLVALLVLSYALPAILVRREGWRTLSLPAILVRREGWRTTLSLGRVVIEVRTLSLLAGLAGLELSLIATGAGSGVFLVGPVDPWSGVVVGVILGLVAGFAVVVWHLVTMLLRGSAAGFSSDECGGGAGGARSTRRDRRGEAPSGLRGRAVHRLRGWYRDAKELRLGYRGDGCLVASRRIAFGMTFVAGQVVVLNVLALFGQTLGGRLAGGSYVSVAYGFMFIGLSWLNDCWLRSSWPERIDRALTSGKLCLGRQLLVGSVVGMTASALIAAVLLYRAPPPLALVVGFLASERLPAPNIWEVISTAAVLIALAFALSRLREALAALSLSLGFCLWMLVYAFLPTSEFVRLGTFFSGGLLCFLAGPSLWRQGMERLNKKTLAPTKRGCR